MSCTHYSSSSIPTDIYNYPISPGTDEWKALKDHGDMITACQIPENILKNISTAGLIETVLNYPLMVDRLAYNNPQEGFNQVASQFNGLHTLLDRRDAGRELLAKYRALDPTDIKNIQTQKETELFLFRFQNTEIILSQYSVISNLSKSELQTLVSDALIKYEGKSQYVSYYGKTGKQSIELLIGRSLQQAKYEPFIQIISENNDLQTFIDSGLYTLNEQISNIIMSLAYTYSHT